MKFILRSQGESDKHLKETGSHLLGRGDQSIRKDPHVIQSKGEYLGPSWSHSTLPLRHKNIHRQYATICKRMTVTVMEQDFVYKNKQWPDLGNGP